MFLSILRIYRLLVGLYCLQGLLIVSRSLSEPIRSHKDLDKDSAPYYHKAVKFYEGLSKQLIHQGHVLDVFACSLDQVGVAELKVAVERSGGLVVLAESFGHSVFKDSLKHVFQSGDLDLGLASKWSIIVPLWHGQEPDE